MSPARRLWPCPRDARNAQHGHNVTIDFVTTWVDFWLFPLLNDTNFNYSCTLILLTFYGTQACTFNNRIFAVLLGGAIPDSSCRAVDSTYYTHILDRRG